MAVVVEPTLTGSRVQDADGAFWVRCKDGAWHCHGAYHGKPGGPCHGKTWEYLQNFGPIRPVLLNGEGRK